MSRSSEGKSDLINKNSVFFIKYFCNLCVMRIVQLRWTSILVSFSAGDASVSQPYHVLLSLHLSFSGNRHHSVIER